MKEITHPDLDLDNWEKYRAVFKGGQGFIDDYVVRLSSREDEVDFSERKQITYCPAHAKAAIIDVRNAIYQRMVDIKRTDGPDSYQKAIKGLNGGVDLKGSTINGFIGCEVLDELLSIGKVGVFVDRAMFEGKIAKEASLKNPPYLYIYQAEQIRSWSIDANNQLTSLLLKEWKTIIDEESGLVTDAEEQYRHFRCEQPGVSKVTYTIYDKDDNPTDSNTLEITKIPFVIFEISQSLLTDVASYQIALLNLASTDMAYSLKSNFPFYTEQTSAVAEMAHLKSKEISGEEIIDNDKDVRVGVAQGRKYGKGLERPGFIHPSPEPLYASIEKQQMLKDEIRQLVNLSILNLKNTRASAESKEMDNQGLEAGLSYVGLELEHGERSILDIWCLYEGTENNGLITYPDKYSLRSDSDRRAEAKELLELSPKIPSTTYQKITAKQVVSILYSTKLKQEDLDAIYGEIDASVAMITDPDAIIADHEAGLVSDETASILRGYPKGESQKAAADHAARAARIAVAQSEAVRGVKDIEVNPNDSKDKQEDKSNVY